MEIRFIDLFAGIGGFRLGLERANKEVANSETSTRSDIRSIRDSSDNTARYSRKYATPIEDISFRCVWSCEIDKYCEQVYKRNFGEGFDAHDVRAVDASAIPDFDLLTSGFPCQSFSIAGKRRGFADTRGTLFFDICRILRAKRPRLLLLENVKGLLSDAEGRTFHTILKSLDELGYDLQWEVLNSKNFGVSQNRERVFIVGHLGGTPRPQVFPLGETDEIHNEQLGEADIAHSLDANYGKGWLDHGQRTMIYQTGRNDRSFEDICPTLQDSRYNLPLLANTLDADGYLRFGARPRDEDGKPQPLPIGYRRLRRLTPLECERLQGFPDGWTEGVSDTQRYKMLGNAVTVNVVEAIGGKLMGVLF